MKPATDPRTPVRLLFRPPLLRITLIGIMLGSIPLVGAWAASKWMIPWADQIAGVTQPDYKAMTQGWWAFGAMLGSFAGGQIASLLGRRRSYFLISLGSMVLTMAMFQLTAPLQPSFLWIVLAQGFVATLFFGWLPLYLPELFPTHVRATGSGISYNVGRFATAGGVLAAGALFTAFGGSYPAVGSAAALIYGLGMLAIAWAPDTTRTSLAFVAIGRPRNTRHSMTHAPDRGNAGSRHRRGSGIVRAGSCLAALLLVVALGATGRPVSRPPSPRFRPFLPSCRWNSLPASRWCAIPAPWRSTPAAVCSSGRGRSIAIPSPTRPATAS